MDRDALAILLQIKDTLTRIEMLIRAQNEDAGVDTTQQCPACGSFDLKDASAMGDERVVCGGCGVNLKLEAVHG